MRIRYAYRNPRSAEGKVFFMCPETTATHLETIGSMYVESDTEYIADVILMRKGADIRIGAGASLTLIARDSVHIEPGVIVRSVGGEDDQSGNSSGSAGNFLVCTTHLEFEPDM